MQATSVERLSSRKSGGGTERHTLLPQNLEQLPAADPPEPSWDGADKAPELAVASSTLQPKPAGMPAVALPAPPLSATTSEREQNVTLPNAKLAARASVEDHAHGDVQEKQGSAASLTAPTSSAQHEVAPATVVADAAPLAVARPLDSHSQTEGAAEVAASHGNRLENGVSESSSSAGISRLALYCPAVWLKVALLADIIFSLWSSCFDQDLKS